MTTNYTNILNSNLDMFDTEEDTFEFSTGIGWDEADWDISEEDWSDSERWESQDYLDKLEVEMDTIVERCGVYGAEEWAEVAAVFSDVYKDVYGVRPYGIGLAYHGIKA